MKVPNLKLFDKVQSSKVWFWKSFIGSQVRLYSQSWIRAVFATVLSGYFLFESRVKSFDKILTWEALIQVSLKNWGSLWSVHEVELTLKVLFEPRVSIVTNFGSLWAFKLELSIKFIWLRTKLKFTINSNLLSQNITWKVFWIN